MSRQFRAAVDKQIAHATRRPADDKREGFVPLRTMTALVVAALMLAAPCTLAAADELYPRHVTKQSSDAVNKGLAYLAKAQTRDGNWVNQADGAAYPLSMASLAGMAFLANGNTPN